MEIAVERVLADYEKRSAQEVKQWHELRREDLMKVRDQFLLAVGPATGQLMNLLVKQLHARTIVEIGTSYGYSTLWLAEAAREVGGKVITLELEAAKQHYAREQLQKAGLADVVDFRLGEARETLAAIREPIDFVLLDLWKDLYIPCFDIFYPKLSPSAVAVADNMIFPEGAQPHAMAYREHVRKKPDMQSLMLPVGSGIEISRCIRGVDQVAI